METNIEKTNLRRGEESVIAISVPFTSLNLLQQTRSIYNSDSMAELAGTLIERDEDGNAVGLRELEQSPRFAVFDSPEAAAVYLKDLNIYHGTDYGPNDLQWVDGQARIAIFGHRRTMALGIAAQEVGIPESELTLKVFEVRNISFDDALVSQLLENIHERPSLADEATAISKYYEYRRFKDDDNNPPSIAEVSRKLGFGTGKVRSALRYCALPEEVRNLAVDDKITYSDAVNAWSLFEAHTAHGEKLEVEGKLKDSNTPTADAYAADATLTDALKIAKYRQVPAKDSKEQWRRWGSKDIDAFILNRLKDIKREVIEPETLFYIETEIATRRRNAVYRGLGDGALKALDILARYSPETLPREALEELLARSTQASQEQDMFEL